MQSEPKHYFKIPQRESESVEKTRGILRQDKPAPLPEPPIALKLANVLKNEMHFNYARRLLVRSSKDERLQGKHSGLRKKVLQELALCTYKDQDLPADSRLSRALQILNEIEDCKTTSDQETLGLLGAIYKRKWEVDNQRQNLDRSRAYYLRGYEQGPQNDQGYTGINAAFVLDQLADLLDKEARAAGDTSPAAENNRAQARAIREEIIRQVEPLKAQYQNQWWYYSTLGEAYFGLRRYKEAVTWLVDGQSAANTVYEWELETCARQLGALARFHANTDGVDIGDLLDSEPGLALKAAFKTDAVPRSAFHGRIGLALSGGGFRASLYHLGVLARLAELDVLRYVEVLSCVSGGAIVGAHYYLKVRHLLQTKTEDAEDVDRITRQDYIDIVHDMIDEFVTGVQQNIRSRVVLNPLKNFLMIWKSRYSRTTRAGELYEKWLFSKVKDGEDTKERWLNKLTIAPLTRLQDGTTSNDGAFSPKYQNWRRDAKVPILVLNAATLNTGHTWQFTATWMGESPSAIDTEVDGNDRLRRMYYHQAPSQYQNIRLGEAVGASAAVPGIFEPMSMDSLYPDRIIRLVDGGVCDNQGVASLFEQDCRVMLVSDASGQMDSQLTASRSIVGVLLRSNSIFQARMREASFHDLKGRRRSGLLRGLMFVHLKGDLGVDPVDWIGSQEPYAPAEELPTSLSSGPLTRYGIRKDVQKLLAGIRTDLDSFSDVEAYSLMVSGYRMTEFEFAQEGRVEGFSAPLLPEKWKFFEIEDCMNQASENPYLKKLLGAGSTSVFKVWQIDPWLKYGLRAVMAVLALSFAGMVVSRWNEPLPSFITQWTTDRLSWLENALSTLTLRKIVVAVAVFASGYLGARILGSFIGDRGAKYVVMLVRGQDLVRRAALSLFLNSVGFVTAAIHLYIFDRQFLRLGTLAMLKGKRHVATLSSRTQIRTKESN